MFEARPALRRACAIAAVTLAGLWSGHGPVIVSRGLAAPPQRLTEAHLWLVPQGDAGGNPALGRAAADLASGSLREPLAVFTRATSDAVLGGYARLYAGRAQLALGQESEAEASARSVTLTQPGGALGEAALWLLADAAEAADDRIEAARALQALVNLLPINAPLAHLRLGRAALKTGDSEVAATAFAKVYYDFPLAPEAEDAALELRRFAAVVPPDLPQRELARAQALYGARRFVDAKKAFDALRGRVSGDDRWLVDLRLAQIEYGQQKYAAARDALRGYLETSTVRRTEAQYFYLSTMRGLGREDDYLSLVRQFVDENPGSSYAETALNDLGTYYILENDDAAAARVFTDLYARFPRGSFADRAAWNAVWWAYKTGNYAETVRLFDSASVAFPRADYRPPWLYWSARANAQLGQAEAARAGFARVVADYRNSYYGRQAMIAAASAGRSSARPAALPGAIQSSARDLPATVQAGTPPANTPLIQALLASGLYDDAIAELRRLQTPGTQTPMIDATIAYALNRKGDLRGGITAMRRAYPQFLAEGGEYLPASILRIIFPIHHWDLIRKYAASHRLDPYFMAALIAQESTFQADVKSPANAWGLMQILPSTGRRYAVKLGIRQFATSMLTNPEINVRIGMALFRDLTDEFGDPAAALAAYNAGESRVSRWKAERPGVSRDEFVDDIPFPETQNYVKRIIGTAEDYRLLYGTGQTGATSAGNAD